MAEFLLLFRGGTHAKPLSPEEAQADIQKWAKWMTDLGKQGKMVGAQPLEKDAKLVRGTKKIVSDGPFAEGKEVIGGYLICKVDTIEEAVAISKDCPILEMEDGSVEVRVIREMAM